MDRLDSSVLAAPVLAGVLLGYGPVIDRQRAVIATRLVVHPTPGAATIDPTALVTAITSVWPRVERLPDGPMGQATPPAPGLGGADAWLSIADAHLWRGVVEAGLPPHVKLEVPGLLLARPGVVPALCRLAAGGTGLLLRGRVPEGVPEDSLPPFAGALLDLQLLKPGEIAAMTVAGRRLPAVVSGIERAEEMSRAFAAGAAAVAGWPLAGEVGAAGRSIAMPDLQVVLELMQRVKAGDPVHKLEEVIKRDPTVAFRLLKFMNSPGVGLAVEVQSFSHAMMLLGAKRLERWLSLLLVSAGQGVNHQPLMFGAVRRGVLMEAIGGAAHDDEVRSDLFICGTFSLLDQLMGAPLVDLLRDVPVPDRVRRALVGASSQDPAAARQAAGAASVATGLGGIDAAPSRPDVGPLVASLRLVEALERGVRSEIQSCAASLHLEPAELNRALLAALRAGEALGA